MFQYIPSRQTNRAKRTATILFVVSLVIFALSAYKGLPYRFAVQGASFAVMTAAIMICVRYLFRCYCYRIEKDDEGWDFNVYELSRSGSLLVCRLSTASLVSVTPWDTYKKMPKSQNTRQPKIYNYCVDIAPKDSYLLEFDGRDCPDSKTPVRIRIQADDEFLNAIRNAPKGD